MSYRNFKSALLVSAFAMSAAPAFAAQDDPLVVVANRLQVAASDTPAAVTVITAEEIAERQAASVFEALRATPGVALTQSGGPGQPATIRIRGSNDDQTLVLVDGVPVNDPAGLVGFDFAYMDTGFVERIEVLRGAGSAIWGSDAIGGVVNIVTVAPGDDVVRAYAEGGSFGTWRAGAKASRALGPVTVSAYATGAQTDGVSAADEDDGNTEKDGAKSNTLGARAIYAPRDGLTIEGGYRATHGQSDFDDYGFVTGTVDGPSVSTTNDTLADARVTWRTDRWGVEGLVSRSLIKRNYETSFPGRYRGERTLARVSADFEVLDGHTLLGGVEREKIDAESLNGAGESESTAGFVLYRGHFGARVLVEAGLRHEEDDRYGDSTTPRIGAAVQAWPGATLKANWGQGYKAPTVDEVTGGGFTGPNPNLKPEESEDWDAGIEQALFGGAAKIGLVYFDREVTNLIQYGFPSYTNTAAITDFSGIEFNASGGAGPLELAFNYTITEAETRGENRQTIRIPKYQASLDLGYQVSEKLRLGGVLFWNGKENDLNTGPYPAVELANDAWTRLDLRAAYRILEHAEIYGRIENATDENYQDVFGYGEPGRAAYGGVRVKF